MPFFIRKYNKVKIEESQEVAAVLILIFLPRTKDGGWEDRER
jgi:hypothetical protein